MLFFWRRYIQGGVNCKCMVNWNLTNRGLFKPKSQDHRQSSCFCPESWCKKEVTWKPPPLNKINLEQFIIDLKDNKQVHTQQQIAPRLLRHCYPKTSNCVDLISQIYLVVSSRRFVDWLVGKFSQGGLIIVFCSKQTKKHFRNLAGTSDEHGSWWFDVLSTSRG